MPGCISFRLSLIHIFGLSSCESFLSENPKDQITEEQAYQNSTLLYLNTVASLYTDVYKRQVLIHGIVRDSQGRKMSKSLGNGIDPLKVIDEYGADALRMMLMVGCLLYTSRCV